MQNLSLAIIIIIVSVAIIQAIRLSSTAMTSAFTSPLTASSPIRSRIHSVILSTFAADSFSLGSHWEYDTPNIAKHFNGKLTTLQSPIASYHKGKSAGDLTHIGYNSLLLLESLKENNGKFVLSEYINKWRGAWDNDSDKHYRDSVTKHVIAELKAGKSGVEAASDDDDMSHTIRWFPLLVTLNNNNNNNEEEFITNVKSLTQQFHRSPNSAITAEFYARTIYSILFHSLTPLEAIKKSSSKINSEWLNEKISLGEKLSSEQQDSLEALRSLGEKKTYGTKTIYTGISCGFDHALPSVIYQINKYYKNNDSYNKNNSNTNPSDVIIDDVNIGGNTNARAMSLAAIFYSAHDSANDKKVTEWINNLKQKNEIEENLTKIETNYSN